MNWKYYDARSGSYKKFIVKKGNNIMGYVVIKIKNNEGYIVDLLANNDDPGIVKKLLDSSIKYLNDNGVNVIRYLAPSDHIYINVFRKCGFVDNRSDRFILYKDKKSIFNEILTEKPKLIFQYADTDWV